MLRILLSACLFLAMAVGAAASDGDAVRDIRKVVVSGDASASATVLRRTGEHLKRAARATRRPVALPRAVMDVEVSGVVYRGDGRNSAKVTITLSDVKGGSPARRTFTVNSFMPGGKGRDAALAEAIARRVALAYHLAPVTSPKAVGKRPGKGRKHAETKRRPAAHGSTQGYAAENRPLVVPTEGALSVRSRALPEGAARKVTPCVVTPTISCD